MTTWTERMHRRAASFGTVVTSCGHSTSSPYPRRIEKVKFGVPIEQVCRNDIPGPLLVMILVLNKEGPFKKDVFRAPGNQANMKKLIHFLQQGRLVNIENFSVHTIASVLKKFLRKIPGGIFGPDGEKRLFEIIEWDNIDRQREEVHKLISSLHVCAQRLLALLIGTFHMISSRANSLHCQTLMSSEALGVSVAPSFFHSCVSEGKNARLVDVNRFKSVEMATKIITFLIDNFEFSNLFGRDNYEYYARITGRILKVENDWIIYSRPVDFMMCCIGGEDSRSTPVLVDPSDPLLESVEDDDRDPKKVPIVRKGSNLGSFKQGAGGRLSVSLGGNGIYQASRVSCPPSSTMASASQADSGRPPVAGVATPGVVTVAGSCQHLGEQQGPPGALAQPADAEDLRARNRYAESTRSLSFLPEVHERQTARMRTRSEWFLSPNISTNYGGKGSRSPLHIVGSACIAEEEPCYYSLSNLPSSSLPQPLASMTMAAAGVAASKFDKTPSVDGMIGVGAAPFTSLENQHVMRPGYREAMGATSSEGMVRGPPASGSKWLWSFSSRPPDLMSSSAAPSHADFTKEFGSGGVLFCLPPLASSTPEKIASDPTSAAGFRGEQKIVRRTSSRKEKRGKKDATAAKNDGSGGSKDGCGGGGDEDGCESASELVASPKKKQRESSGGGGGAASAAAPETPYNPRI